ncbi:MAG: hypothetical protein IPM70_16490 [Proteobacteria bacterium]|nr:hypothetical protein [Pseudomonadota bacterium]
MLMQRLYRALRRKDPDRFGNFVGSGGCVRAAASHVVWNELQGDYLEFGVFAGASFIEAFHSFAYHSRKRRQSMHSMHAEHAATNTPARRYFAFDSFEGLPDSPERKHADYFQGSYSCSREEFERNVIAAGVPREVVVAVPGLFGDTLVPELKRRHELTRAAVVMIDCDLYESTVPVLEFITDLVDQGTIIIFDDWFRFAGSRSAGERRACIEWLARHPDIQLEDWWQQGPQSKAFLVHRSR